MVEELLQDNICKQALRRHTLGQRHYRKRSQFKGVPLGILYLEVRFESQLVTDDTADIDLRRNQYQRVRHLRIQFSIVFAVFNFRIYVLFPDFRIGRIDGLARLALKASDLDEICGILLVFLYGRFQFCTLFFSKRIVEQGGLAKHRGIQRKVLLAHLSEHLLPKPVELVFQTGDLVPESLNLCRLGRHDFLFGGHLFRSLSTI